MLDAEITGFLQEGLALQLGTRNANLEPNGARATAIRVEDDREHVILYVPKHATAAVFTDLKSNGQAAIAACRPVDDKACQIKGTFVSMQPAEPADRDFVIRQWQGFMKQLDAIGLPSDATTTWLSWPCVAVRIKVTAVFNQTPGPQAGKPL